jgi:chemotaxis response regulator CheB
LPDGDKEGFLYDQDVSKPFLSDGCMEKCKMTKILGQRQIRVLVVDEDQAMLRVVTGYLTQYPQLQLVGAVALRDQVLDAVKMHQPDMILISMEGAISELMESIGLIRKVIPCAWIVIMSDDDQFSGQMETVGIANAFIKKDNFSNGFQPVLQSFVRR